MCAGAQQPWKRTMFMVKSLGAASVSSGERMLEVALPQEAINRESAREKSIRHGDPSTLHLPLRVAEDNNWTWASKP